eukprot:XP_020400870.1 extensin-like [Zea mays]
MHEHGVRSDISTTLHVTGVGVHTTPFCHPQPPPSLRAEASTAAASAVPKSVAPSKLRASSSAPRPSRRHVHPLPHRRNPHRLRPVSPPQLPRMRSSLPSTTLYVTSVGVHTTPFCHPQPPRSRRRPCGRRRAQLPRPQSPNRSRPQSSAHRRLLPAHPAAASTPSPTKGIPTDSAPCRLPGSPECDPLSLNYSICYQCRRPHYTVLPPAAAPQPPPSLRAEASTAVAPAVPKSVAPSKLRASSSAPRPSRRRASTLHRSATRSRPAPKPAAAAVLAGGGEHSGRARSPQIGRALKAPRIVVCSPPIPPPRPPPPPPKESPQTPPRVASPAPQNAILSPSTTLYVTSVGVHTTPFCHPQPPRSRRRPCGRRRAQPPRPQSPNRSRPQSSAHRRLLPAHPAAASTPSPTEGIPTDSAPCRLPGSPECDPLSLNYSICYQCRRPHYTVLPPAAAPQPPPSLRAEASTAAAPAVPKSVALKAPRIVVCSPPIPPPRPPPPPPKESPQTPPRVASPAPQNAILSPSTTLYVTSVGVHTTPFCHPQPPRVETRSHRRPCGRRRAQLPPPQSPNRSRPQSSAHRRLLPAHPAAASTPSPTEGIPTDSAPCRLPGSPECDPLSLNYSICYQCRRPHYIVLPPAAAPRRNPQPSRSRRRPCGRRRAQLPRPQSPNRSRPQSSAHRPLLPAHPAAASTPSPTKGIPTDSAPCRLPGSPECDPLSLNYSICYQCRRPHYTVLPPAAAPRRNPQPPPSLRAEASTAAAPAVPKSVAPSKLRASSSAPRPSRRRVHPLPHRRNPHRLRPVSPPRLPRMRSSLPQSPLPQPRSPPSLSILVTPSDDPLSSTPTRQPAPVSMEGRGKA